MKKNLSDFKDLHVSMVRSMVGCFTTVNGTALQPRAVHLIVLPSRSQGKTSSGNIKSQRWRKFSPAKEDKYAALDSRKPS